MFRRTLGPAAIAVFAMTTGCNDLSGLAGSQSLPSGVSDPNTVKTEGGALKMYQTARYTFEPALGTGLPYSGAFVAAILGQGVISDELQSDSLGGTPLQYIGLDPSLFALDARQLPEETDPSVFREPSLVAESGYNSLQQTRGAASLALGALAAYAPHASPALRGHLFSLQGYSEILLAEMFCSGVPLSTFDFQGDFTYAAGSTTQQVYGDAVAKFDSALALSADSANFLNLARVGKGRALLDLDSAAAAATAVAAVPDEFAYRVTVNWSETGGQGNFEFQAAHATVADSDGGTGLPYISGGDPRTAVVPYGSNGFGATLYFPAKYVSPFATSPVSVADGAEARLIEAEAALRANDPARWLERLNYLRHNAVVFGQTDTLPTLQDPGTDSTRVDLLFRERAYWLFVTGHRQSDLRRLIRQYHRRQQDVFPSGRYPTGTPATYGSDVTAPIPSRERINRLYTGCLNRGA